MPEQNRDQYLGELSAQPTGVELPPATRADLLDPALWQDGLAKYARATNLSSFFAVAPVFADDDGDNRKRAYDITEWSHWRTPLADRAYAR